MKLEININDDFYHELAVYAKSSEKTLNEIIVELLETKLEEVQKKVWPQIIYEFTGEPDFLRFETSRTNLK